MLLQLLLDTKVFYAFCKAHYKMCFQSNEEEERETKEKREMTSEESQKNQKNTCIFFCLGSRVLFYFYFVLFFCVCFFVFFVCFVKKKDVEE